MYRQTTIAFAVALAVSAADAQDRGHDAWVAWYGCWQAPGGAVTCVLPGDQSASARVVAWRDGVATQERVAVADGRPRALRTPDCEGAERFTPSRDGTRIEESGELRCAGRATQATSGLHAIVDGDWLAIESVGGGAGRPIVQVLRRRALPWSEIPGPLAGELASLERAAVSARAQANVGLSAARIADVSRAAGPAVAEAWMLESSRGLGRPLPLARSDLEAFAEADLPASVIDLAVALANPRHFHLDIDGRPLPVASLSASGGASDAMAMAPMPMMNCFVPPFMGMGMMPYISCMDIGAYPFVSQWGFTRWGTYPGFFPGYGYPVVVVQPGGGTRPPIDNGGRVIRGQGYTPRGEAGRGGAQPRGSSTPSARSGAQGSGSRGSSTGRTAKPRNP